mmetsp:Transcript_9211/g.37775  ORF Transcript_9211/g.37775 Transcript_9211/m.37775 type:complete len:242 (+) Transcript_9211:424-1149(+)
MSCYCSELTVLPCNHVAKPMIRQAQQPSTHWMDRVGPPVHTSVVSWLQHRQGNSWIILLTFVHCLRLSVEHLVLASQHSLNDCSGPRNGAPGLRSSFDACIHQVYVRAGTDARSTPMRRLAKIWTRQRTDGNYNCDPCKLDTRASLKARKRYSIPRVLCEALELDAIALYANQGFVCLGASTRIERGTMLVRVRLMQCANPPVVMAGSGWRTRPSTIARRLELGHGQPFRWIPKAWTTQVM